MKEALASIINYGFNAMELNRIEAYASTGNLPSLLLLRGFEFTKEGIMRSHYFNNNVMEDSICFSLLRSEYKGV
jgi:ribosomal-protein-alanine N-acetyltransferase